MTPYPERIFYEYLNERGMVEDINKYWDEYPSSPHLPPTLSVILQWTGGKFLLFQLIDIKIIIPEVLLVKKL